MARYREIGSGSIKLNLPKRAMDTVIKLAMVSNKPLATTLTHFVERSLPEMLEVIEILEQANNLPKIDTSAMLESAQRKHTKKINKPLKKKPKKAFILKTKKAVKPNKTNISSDVLGIHSAPFGASTVEQELEQKRLNNQLKKIN